MRRGFTLLELIVVIIIIGVLATLGFAQYGRMVERSRGAEARAVAGAIRTFGNAYRFEHNNDLGGFTPELAGIGGSADQIPGNTAANCRGTHYFWYDVSADNATDQIVITATRCTSADGDGGKEPSGNTALTLTLTTDYDDGTDVWGGTGGY